MTSAIRHVLHMFPLWNGRKMCVVLQHNLGKGSVPPPLHPPAYRRIQALSLPAPSGELGRSPVNRRR